MKCNVIIIFLFVIIKIYKLFTKPEETIYVLRVNYSIQYRISDPKTTLTNFHKRCKQNNNTNTGNINTRMILQTDKTKQRCNDTNKNSSLAALCWVGCRWQIHIHTYTLFVLSHTHARYISKSNGDSKVIKTMTKLQCFRSACIRTDYFNALTQCFVYLIAHFNTHTSTISKHIYTDIERYTEYNYRLFNSSGNVITA